MLLDNLRGILSRLPQGVELLVATKYASLEQLEALLRSGLVSHCGENRVQEAERKLAALGFPAGFPQIQWHMIGNLQKNKVGKAFKIFQWIDSLDDLGLAQSLETLAQAQKITVPVLVQIKGTQKDTQHGILPEELGNFLQAAKGYKHLQIRGLMGIAPKVEPVEKVRPYFQQMKDLFDKHFKPGTLNFKPYLSMGMSRDFEIAVQEGANLVRIGSAIFKSS